MSAIAVYTVLTILAERAPAVQGQCVPPGSFAAHQTHRTSGASCCSSYLTRRKYFRPEAAEDVVITMSRPRGTGFSLHLVATVYPNAVRDPHVTADAAKKDLNMHQTRRLIPST